MGNACLPGPRALCGMLSNAPCEAKRINLVMGGIFFVCVLCVFVGDWFFCGFLTLKCRMAFTKTLGETV